MAGDKFVHPVNDGTVLPILHLNGYKIANSTVLARIPEDELLPLMEGFGHRPYVVEGGFDGEDPMAVHARMAAMMDEIVDEIARIRAHAKEQFDADEPVDRPRWPALVLRTPKGWTGPREVDGTPSRARGGRTRCRWRRPATTPLTAPSWSMAPVVPAAGAVRRRGPPGPRAARAGPGRRPSRMSATPHANGGELLRDLRLPDFTAYAVDVPVPGSGPFGTAPFWARGCATSSGRTRTTSGSWPRTRPRPTGCRPSSTSPTGSSSAAWFDDEDVAQSAG